MEDSHKKYLTFMTKTAQKMTIFFQELANEGEKFYAELRKQLKSSEPGEIQKKQQKVQQIKQIKIKEKLKGPPAQTDVNPQTKKNGKKKQIQTQKDTKKPKPPDSSFQIYLKQNQAQIQRTHGQSNKFNIMKLASQLWKTLPQQKKQEYQVKAEKDRNRYQQETKTFEKSSEDNTNQIQKSSKKSIIQNITKKYSSNEEESKLMKIIQNSSQEASQSKSGENEEYKKSNKNMKKRKKDLGTQIQHLKPKAPTSSFLLFLHQNKKAFSEKYGVRTNSQLTKIASKQWKLITQQAKNEYIQKSQLSKQNYHQRMKEYNEKYADQLAQIRYRKKQISKQKSRQKKRLKREANVIEKGETEQKSNSQSNSEPNSEDSLMQESPSNAKQDDSIEA